MPDASQPLWLHPIPTAQTALAQGFDKEIFPPILSSFHSPQRISAGENSTAGGIFTAEATAGPPREGSHAGGIGAWASCSSETKPA